MRGGLAVLGFADEPDDTLEGAVLFSAGHLDDQAPPGVERPPGDVRSGLFRGRFGLSREVGFIHRALAGEHLAVRRHEFAGQDHDAVAGVEGRDRHLGFDVIRTESAGMFGRLVEEGVDGPAGAVHRVMFDRAGRRKEKKQEGSLPLGADDPGAGRHDDHQQVDVDAFLSEGGPAVDRGVPSAGEAGAGDEDERPGRPGFAEAFRDQ